jgi:transcriptional regulator with XRE-family HTH domain
MKKITRQVIAQQIGARMQAARECRGLDQKAVAAQMAIEPQRLSAYESGLGSVTVVELERLAQILSIPINYFFEGCPVCGNA